MKPIFACFLFFLATCSQKNNKPQQVRSAFPATQSPKEKFSIRFVGSVLFNKSYSFLMSSTMSKEEIEKMYQETDRSNPTLLETDKKDKTINLFEKFGFVNRDELLLNKFKFSSRATVRLNDSLFADVKIPFHHDPDQPWKLYTVSGNDSTEFTLGHDVELKYALFDIKPGCKEIVVLDESYISNNYLWNFLCYELRTE